MRGGGGNGIINLPVRADKACKTFPRDFRKKEKEKEGDEGERGG